MPWWDPASDPEVLDHMDLSWLRRRTPKNRTSTWKRESPNAILGEAGEVVVVGRIQIILDDLGLNWSVGRTGSSNSMVKQIDLGPCHEDESWVPIENSTKGDVHVIDNHGRRRVSFEVKASMEYDNATISRSELEYSEAEYLVGVTRAGLWVCSMEEARRYAREKHSAYGSFYVVPYDSVHKIQLRDVFPTP